MLSVVSPVPKIVPGMLLSKIFVRLNESLYLLWFPTLLASESFHFYHLSFILNLFILTHSSPFNYAQSLLT